MCIFPLSEINFPTEGKIIKSPKATRSFRAKRFLHEFGKNRIYGRSCKAILNGILAPLSRIKRLGFLLNFTCVLLNFYSTYIVIEENGTRMV